jgi:hypothetical protein
MNNNIMSHITIFRVVKTPEINESKFKLMRSLINAAKNVTFFSNCIRTAFDKRLTFIYKISKGLISERMIELRCMALKFKSENIVKICESYVIEKL